MFISFKYIMDKLNGKLFLIVYCFLAVVHIKYINEMMLQDSKRLQYGFKWNGLFLLQLLLLLLLPFNFSFVLFLFLIFNWFRKQFRRALTTIKIGKKVVGERRRNIIMRIMVVWSLVFNCIRHFPLLYNFIRT